MKTLEKVDSTMTYDQLVFISCKGEMDYEDSISAPYNHIDGHPLLQTSNLIGSVLVRICNDELKLAHMQISHAAPVYPKELSTICTSSIFIKKDGAVAIQITPITGNELLHDYIDDLLYSQQTYLPRTLVDEFAREKASTITKTSLTLSDTPELIDFIHGTATNSK